MLIFELQNYKIIKSCCLKPLSLFVAATIFSVYTSNILSMLDCITHKFDLACIHSFTRWQCRFFCERCRLHLHALNLVDHSSPFQRGMIIEITGPCSTNVCWMCVCGDDGDGKMGWWFGQLFSSQVSGPIGAMCHGLMERLISSLPPSQWRAYWGLPVAWTWISMPWLAGSLEYFKRGKGFWGCFFCCSRDMGLISRVVQWFKDLALPQL